MPKKRLLLHNILKGIRPKYISNVWMNSEGARNDWALFFTCTICNSISFFLVKIILLTLYHKLKTSRDIIFMQQNEKKMPERHLLWDTYTYTKYFGLIIDRTCNVIKMSLQWSMAEALNAYHYLIKMAKLSLFCFLHA